jgi:hypothetical protein
LDGSVAPEVNAGNASSSLVGPAVPAVGTWVQQQTRPGEAGWGLLVMGVAGDGRAWQWRMPLLGGALPDAKVPAQLLPPAPRPDLLGE